MKKMRASFKSKNYDDLNKEIDFEAYYELAENGLCDRDIAHEMNISQSFLENIKKQTNEYL